MGISFHPEVKAAVSDPAARFFLWGGRGGSPLSQQAGFHSVLIIGLPPLPLRCPFTVVCLKPMEHIRTGISSARSRLF